MSICNGDNERKLKVIGIFLSPRGKTLPKIIRRPHYQTQPLYSRDKPMYTFLMKISKYDREYERKLNPEGRKWVTLYGGGIKNHNRF